MGLARGDFVVCRGVGLAQVQKLERGGGVTLQPVAEDSEPLTVAAAEHDKRLRAPVDKAAAEKLVALLSKGDPLDGERSWGEQYKGIHKALKTGDARPLATALAELLRHPAPLPKTHERALYELEDVLLPELARALGLEPRTLRSRLHRSAPAFALDDAEPSGIRPAPVPKALPKGWTCAGSFRVSTGKLLAGELAEDDLDSTFPGTHFRTNVAAKARKGAWFALVPADGRWAGVFVHAESMPQFEALLRQARELGKVVLRSGTFAVLDAAEKDARSFARAHEAAVGQSIDGRGFLVATASDGKFPVLAHLDGGEAVLVATPFE